MQQKQKCFLVGGGGWVRLNVRGIACGDDINTWQVALLIAMSTV